MERPSKRIIVSLENESNEDDQHREQDDQHFRLSTREEDNSARNRKFSQNNDDFPINSFISETNEEKSESCIECS